MTPKNLQKIKKLLKKYKIKYHGDLDFISFYELAKELYEDCSKNKLPRSGYYFLINNFKKIL
jgi:hypothetical protein